MLIVGVPLGAKVCRFSGFEDIVSIFIDKEINICRIVIMVLTLCGWPYLCDNVVVSLVNALSSHRRYAVLCRLA